MALLTPEQTCRSKDDGRFRPGPACAPTRRATAASACGVEWMNGERPAHENGLTVDVSHYWLSGGCRCRSALHRGVRGWFAENGPLRSGPSSMARPRKLGSGDRAPEPDMGSGELRYGPSVLPEVEVAKFLLGRSSMKTMVSSQLSLGETLAAIGHHTPFIDPRFIKFDQWRGVCS